MLTIRRTALYTLVIVAVWFIFPSDSIFSWMQQTETPIVDEYVPHPIPKLMADAELQYRDLVNRQSRTLNAAIAEYKRRYDRDPPKGFDEWFAFAMENDVKMIDEYNGMIEELAPFWDLSGEEIRRRAQQAGFLPSIDLVRLRNGETVTLNINKGFEDTEVNARAKGFRVMIEKFQKKLPDMDFPINAKAEGRVLVPWEHRMYPNLTKTDSSGGSADMLGGVFVPDWKGDGNVWEEFRRTCDPSSPARRLFDSVRGRAATSGSQRPPSHLQRGPAASVPLRVNADLEFAVRPDDTYDFCQHPWARYQHGHFFSDWRTLPVLYPVFSPARAPGYGDIVIPSHYYYSSTKKYTYGWDPVNMVIKDVDDGEVPWDQKTEMIFWRGATTGGGSSPAGFSHSYQRHRLIDMLAGESNTTVPVVFADPAGSDGFVRAEVPVRDMNSEIVDAAFTKAVGCADYSNGCEGMMQRYRFSKAVPMATHWQHKYLVDVDGMGYSARVMAFLMSESAVVKSTVYREFFTDWIQPWLHYIPLSQSYKEIYNIHAYFSGPSPSMLRAANSTTLTNDWQRPKHTEGDRQLRHIAHAGRKWKQTVGRKVDMEVYVYRLCLEYARLWADDREAMSYSG